MIRDKMNLKRHGDLDWVAPIRSLPYLVGSLTHSEYFAYLAGLSVRLANSCRRKTALSAIMCGPVIIVR